ncbi:MAG: type II secretion system protein GspM [Burkholderiaceae bacterium]
MKLPPALQARWAVLAPREKIMVACAAAVVVLAVIWLVLVAPALATLRTAAEAHRAVDAQWQLMANLQAQAQTLQSQPRLSTDDVLRALELSVRQRLGAGATLNASGERATVTLKGVPADALAQWLAQARVNARVLPSEARLTRGTAPGTWDGTLALALPPR